MIYNLYAGVVAEWNEKDMESLHSKAKPLKLDNKPINTKEGSIALRRKIRTWNLGKRNVKTKERQNS